MSDERSDVALARVTAALLAAAGTPCALASATMSTLSMFRLSQGAADWVTWLAALLGLPALYYAIRVRFDAALFDGLADDATANDLDPLPLQALDLALSNVVGRETAQGAPPRSLASRVRGARRLLIAQVAIVLLQVVATAWLLLPGNR